MSSSRRISTLAATLAAAVVLSLAGSGATLAQAAKQAPQAPSAPAVSVVRALERDIVEQAVVTGTLVPFQEILVAPEVEGYRIAGILVEEGDVVTEGQILARLTRDLLETTLAQNAAARARADAAIAQAKSQIVQSEAAQTEAQQALERTRSLMRSGNTTEVVLEQRVSAARVAEGRGSASRDGLRIAEADKASAEAQRREIEWRLSRTEVRAPTAGVISRKTARIGATATAAGEPLFRIIADGAIELEGEVTETQLPRIQGGAAALVTVDGTRMVAGKVRNIFPEVDRATRLGKVRISLPSDASLRIGSFARGTIEVARTKGVAVPVSALVYGAEGATVLAVVNDRVEARRVRTGLSAGGFIEIVEGVAAGEFVVARAGSFLRDGDTVRPMPVEPQDRTAQNEGSR